MKITVLKPDSSFGEYASVLFNGENLIEGTYTREVDANGMFSAGFRVTKVTGMTITVSMNGSTIASIKNPPLGEVKTAEFRVSDYASSGITLKGYMG